MYTLEQYLALSTVEKPVINNIDILSFHEEDGVLWLVFTYKSSKKNTYKVNIKEIAWSDLTTMYETFIWSDMIRKGYILINIEGGSLVISPTGEEYQLSEDECTCPNFIQGQARRGICKHLLFREGELNYRKRQVDYLSSKLPS